MARTKSKAKAAAASAVVRLRDKDRAPESKPELARKNGMAEMFSRAACVVAHWMGKPIAFLTAAAVVIVWAVSGPLFGFSDTWQLVINTSTTIVTFLMVFLIQNTQNRDTLALQLKLSELILVMNEAENRFATAEDLTEEELEKLHKELHERAQNTLDTLHTRRAGREKKAS